MCQYPLPYSILKSSFLVHFKFAVFSLLLDEDPHTFPIGSCIMSTSNCVAVTTNPCFTIIIIIIAADSDSLHQWCVCDP